MCAGCFFCLVCPSENSSKLSAPLFSWKLCLSMTNHLLLNSEKWKAFCRMRKVGNKESLFTAILNSVKET